MTLRSFEPAEHITEEGTTEIIAAIARCGSIPGLKERNGRSNQWVLLPIRKLFPVLQGHKLTRIVQVIELVYELP